MNHAKKVIPLIFVLLVVGYINVIAQEMVQREMTIQQISESVQQNNIQLKLASTAVKVADARIGEAKTNRLPDINTDMKAFYLSDVNIYSTGFKKLQTIDLPNFGHQFNVSASQLLFAGGKINKSINLAELGSTLANNRLGDTEQEVNLGAAQLYINLYNLLNQKKIIQNNQALAIERTKNARLYFEQDMITKNEVLRAEVLERQLEQSILQVQNSISITNKRLTILAGLSENTLIIPTLANINHQVREQNENYYREVAFQKNLQLIAGDTQIAIAKKNLELTKTDRAPTLAAFSGYNANRPQTSGAPADLYSNSYQAGLSLSYNIASLYKNPKKEAVNKILINQAVQQREAIRQQIETDVNTAYTNYHLAVAQLKVSASNKTAADENYRITELKYKNQLVTYIEIIDAANIKLQADLQMLNDQTDIILNYVRLLRVTGQLKM